jgi:hypothetical protein
LVTGGLASMAMRAAIPAVVSSQATKPSESAQRARRSGHTSQETKAASSASM